MQIENTAVSSNTVDTNEEYIIPQNAAKEPPVLGTVFKAIIVETVKDFFGGIIGFFLRYVKHFIDCFRYFWSPSLERKPFDKKNYKEHCQHSFELVMLVLFAIIFLVKLELIPATSKNLLDLYNNDLTQMLMQFLIFIIFAVTYFVLVIFSILTGRVFRSMFKIPVAKKESDILYIYLTNALFSFASLVALWARCSTSNATGDSTQIAGVIFTIFLALCFPLFLLWSIRFSRLNKLSAGKGMAFTFTITFLYTLFFSFADAMVTMFLVGV
jgi:hypothetical protein